MKDQLAMSQRFGLFLLGIIYGLFGSPSPDHIGLIEIVIFCLLVLSIGIKGFTAPTAYLGNRTPHTSLVASPVFWLLLLFIWGTVVSTTIGLFNSTPLSWLVRDYASFLLLCLPLFFITYIDSKQFQKVLTITIIGIGSLFSLRIIQSIYTGSTMTDTGTANSLYLSISPEILFTSCFMCLTTIGTIFFGGTKMPLHHKVTIIAGSISITAITAYILYINTMRAGIGALALSTVIILVWALIYKPKRAILFMIFVSLLFVASGEHIQNNLIIPLLEKQQLVGLNQRMEELDAVAAQHANSTLSHVFGKGWGAGIESPSSAELMVNFTHSLFSSLWLKTGIVGCILMALFFISMFIKIFHVVPISQHRCVTMMIALVLCIFINMLLYGGYKSLGFGLCLTLLLSTCYVGLKTHKSIAPTP